MKKATITQRQYGIVSEESLELRRTPTTWAAEEDSTRSSGHSRLDQGRLDQNHLSLWALVIRGKLNSESGCLYPARSLSPAGPKGPGSEGREGLV